MQQKIIVKAIIKKDDKTLLLMRSKNNVGYAGLYELPGGKVDIGEDPRHALAREVQEETNLTLQVVQLSDVLSFIDTDKNCQYVVIVFFATIESGGRIMLGSDHSSFSWKKMSEIHQSAITPLASKVLNVPITNSAKTNDIASYTNNDDIKTSTIDSVIIYTDGGSRGNPGPSASGYVIKDIAENIVSEGGEYLGITTNNQAEYLAVKVALEKAIELGAQHVQLRLDSQLVANQLTGVYQIKNRDLWPINSAIKQLIGQLKSVRITHVRREFNKEADAMVNKILDAQVVN